MRIVLVQLPPMPVGALTLAAVANQMGQEVEVIDFPKRGGEQDFLSRVTGADLVGFTTVCTKYPRTILLAKRLKALNPATLIVFGGPQATITSNETLLTFSFVDLIIRGEAETAWACLVDQLRSGDQNWSSIPGAVWREGNRLIENAAAPLCQDLDSLPMPLYKAYPEIAKFPFAMIEVGRGCPYTCTFCCTNTFFSRQPRMKSPERIVAEMDYLHSLFGTSTFDFVHDMFTYRSETVSQICELLKKRPYRWGCSSRTDTLNGEMLDMMKDAGCTGFYFGVETGSPRMQKLLKKNLDVSEAVHVIDMVKRKGFRATVSVIFGFPQETLSDIKDSLLLVTELMARDVDTLQLPVWGPLADTPLTNSCREFKFNGELSNFADTDGVISPAEEKLIRANFRLFSTFYYPLETEYSRHDYLVLTTVLEELNNFPMTRHFILERDRIGFVNFLVRGHFGVDRLKFSSLQMAEKILRDYALTSTHGSALLRVVDFDKAVSRVANSSVGSRELSLMGAAEAKTILSRLSVNQALGLNDRVPLWLIKDQQGVRVAIGESPAGSSQVPA